MGPTPAPHSVPQKTATQDRQADQQPKQDIPSHRTAQRSSSTWKTARITLFKENAARESLSSGARRHGFGDLKTQGKHVLVKSRQTSLNPWITHVPPRNVHL